MGYITTEYYKDVHHGSAPDSEIAELIERASDIIGGMMFREPDISALTEQQLSLFRRAVAVEVDYLDDLGGAAAAVSSVALSQATLGKFSYSRGGTSGGGRGYNGVNVCPLAVSLLEKAGLLGRGLAP